MRPLAGCLLAAALAAVPAASGSSAALPVRTLVEVRGTIEAFAQDGRYVAWLNREPVYANPSACPRLVQLRDLRTGRTSSLVGRRSTLCRQLRDENGTFGSGMALARTRALWAWHTGSNNSDYAKLYTGSPGRDREAGDLQVDRYDEDDPGLGEVPLAGDGPTLVWADISASNDATSEGVFRVDRAGVTYLPETEDTYALAADGGRTALARYVQPGCVCNYSPTWSPSGGEIAFINGGGEGGRTRLSVMRADGSQRRELPVGTGVLTVDWSPGGRMLAFDRYSPADRGAVFVSGADGSGRRRIGAGHDPVWSPDGRWLAFARYSSSGRDSVFRVAAGGGRASRVTLGSSPSWSPDGTRLVVTRRDGLYVVGADGSGARRIRTDDSVDAPKWSPDGRLIAYYSYGSDGVWVVTPEGTNAHRLAGLTQELGDWSGDWSPDSRSVVGIGSGGLVVAAADGGSERALGPGFQPMWSPDGGGIAFLSPVGEEREEGAEVARIGVDGTDRRVLTHTNPAPERYAVEVRATATGRRIAAFSIDPAPSEVALSGSRLALLYPRTLEIRSFAGAVVRRAAVAPAWNLSFSGRWAVFGAGRTVRAFDVRSGRSIVLSGVRGGFSIDGRRVAWLEPGRTRSRIRALVLPQ